MTKILFIKYYCAHCDQLKEMEITVIDGSQLKKLFCPDCGSKEGAIIDYSTKEVKNETNKS